MCDVSLGEMEEEEGERESVKRMGSLLHIYESQEEEEEEVEEEGNKLFFCFRSTLKALWAPTILGRKRDKPVEHATGALAGRTGTFAFA